MSHFRPIVDFIMCLEYNFKKGVVQVELNSVELALKEIYDGWQLGNEKENNGYSAMFRMGYPDEYIVDPF